jgi:hypothetical protein
MRILQMIAHEISQTHQAADISLINGAWTALTIKLSDALDDLTLHMPEKQI